MLLGVICFDNLLLCQCVLVSLEFFDKNIPLFFITLMNIMNL